jgi:hypothetical protein
MIEGSGAGSLPRTNGSRAGRIKNIRIRIRNTDQYQERANCILQETELLFSGFDKEKTTLDELLEHFADHEPAVVNIQMRTYVDKRDKDKKRHFKVRNPVFETYLGF